MRVVGRPSYRSPWLVRSLKFPLHRFGAVCKSATNRSTLAQEFGLLQAFRLFEAFCFRSTLSAGHPTVASWPVGSTGSRDAGAGQGSNAGLCGNLAAARRRAGRRPRAANGKMSKLIITDAQRLKLISDINSYFGKKLDQETQPWLVSGAWVLRSYLQKGYTPRPGQ